MTKEEQKNDSPSMSVNEQRFIESAKLIYDVLKHSTTISTGSILILVAFLEKLFKEPTQKWLVGVSLLALVVSVVSSLITMFFLSVHVNKDFDLDSAEMNTLAIAFAVCLLSFSVGIVSFVAFSLVNFY